MSCANHKGMLFTPTCSMSTASSLLHERLEGPRQLSCLRRSAAPAAFPSTDSDRILPESLYKLKRDRPILPSSSERAHPSSSDCIRTCAPRLCSSHICPPPRCLRGKRTVLVNRRLYLTKLKLGFIHDFCCKRPLPPDGPRFRPLRFKPPPHTSTLRTYDLSRYSEQTARSGANVACKKPTFQARNPSAIGTAVFALHI